jgi:hypothetical protein
MAASQFQTVLDNPAILRKALDARRGPAMLEAGGV